MSFLDIQFISGFHLLTLCVTLQTFLNIVMLCRAVTIDMQNSREGSTDPIWCCCIHFIIVDKLHWRFTFPSSNNAVRRLNIVTAGLVICHITRHNIHRVRKKKRPGYFSHNFEKFRCSFVIFGTNHPDTSMY